MCINVRCRYNWAENMRAWRLDMHLPYPGAAGALVHSGALEETAAMCHVIGLLRVQGPGNMIAPRIKLVPHDMPQRSGSSA
jgi:hypothetical protein